MTPRLWEDVLELQKQAKLKDNVVFSAQGAPKKSLGTLKCIFRHFTHKMTEGTKISVKGPNMHFLGQNRKK